MVNDWPRKQWQFNLLNIYNFNLDGPYSYIFEFLRKNQELLQGDILEAGVYRGRMTLSMGLFLKQLGLPGNIHGFDTFKGFPKLSREDLFENFQILFERGIITDQHHEDIKLLAHYNKNILSRGVAPDEISSSGRFQDARYLELIRKKNWLGLDNIILHEGDFNDTMKKELLPEAQFSLIFIDCDLYSGYQTTLNFAWEKLVAGGIVFLDEYYSLKFPGARIAVKEYFANRKDFDLIQVAKPNDDFERWIVQKNG